MGLNAQKITIVNPKGRQWIVCNDAGCEADDEVSAAFLGPL